MTEPDDFAVNLGDSIYDAAGEEVGTVRGFDDSGFYVAIEGVDSIDVEGLTSSPKLAEAELMWRCWDCGEMGSVAEVPEACPACGAPREDLYYWTED